MSGSGNDREARLQRSIADLFTGDDDEDDDTYEPATELEDEASDGDDYAGRSPSHILTSLC